MKFLSSGHSAEALHALGGQQKELIVMQVVKPREEYVMVIDADSILRKPFIPEELHLELGE